MLPWWIHLTREYAVARVVVLLLLLVNVGRSDEFIRANFHAHAASDLLRDDGAEPSLALHQVHLERGFAFSVHTAHSNVNDNDKVAHNFSAARAREQNLGLALTTDLGEELTVSDGKHHQSGNQNHLSLLGISHYVPSHTPLARACTEAHRDGGVCIVNHPGPGPMMWEEGLWEAPENRKQIDALEVYNGQAMLIDLDFEERYLQATAYSGLGLHIAAVTGTDTHGPKTQQRIGRRSRLVAAAAKILHALRNRDDPRPELQALTLVLTKSRAEADVLDAVRARKTIAAFGPSMPSVECIFLGEVRHDSAVDLRFSASRPIEEISLYREGKLTKTWSNQSAVSFAENISQPAAYVFALRDHGTRMLTSAIWFEPQPK